MPKGLIAIDGTPPEVIAPWAPADAALLMVANRPLVHHAVDTLRRAGAGEIIVVAEADTAAATRSLLGAGAPALEFIETAAPPSVAQAMLAARDRLEGERFLVHTGEGLLVRDHALLARALEDAETDAAVFFHTDRAADPPPTKLALRRKGEAPEPRLAGVHAFGPAILDHLAGGARLADAIERLADAGGRVQGGVLEHWWRYRGTPDGLLDVNRRVLDELEPDGLSPTEMPATRLEGRVLVHPTAHLATAMVRGPAIIGAHARVTDAYVGPYSSIGDGAVIDNAEIASSIVLPRARIRHVGVRVEDSIVGPGATVGRDFALPKAMRLLVGSEAHITLG